MCAPAARTGRGAPADQPILDEHRTLALDVVVRRINELLPHDTAAMAGASGSGFIGVRIDLQCVFVRTENATPAECGNANTFFGFHARDRETSARLSDQSCRAGGIVVTIARDLLASIRWFDVLRMDARLGCLAFHALPNDVGIRRLKAAFPWSVCPRDDCAPLLLRRRLRVD